MSDLREGDCRAILPTLAESSFDAVVTDPPYELGFMGKGWDSTGIIFDVSMWKAVLRVLKPAGYMFCFGGTRTYHRLACAIEDAGFELRDCLMWLYGSGLPKGQGCLKPAWEPILLARKPGKRVLPLGIDACRAEGTKRHPGNYHDSGSVGGVRTTGKFAGSDRSKFDATTGRYPANVVHDGSEEVAEAFAAFGETHHGHRPRNQRVSPGSGRTMGNFGVRGETGEGPNNGYGDSGTAARFFYCAKASKRERGQGNTHPTVKPLALMRWLVRLITPPGGRVLDPFAGSGTTLLAAEAEGMHGTGIEQDAKHCGIIRQRLATASKTEGLFAEAV